ncbi:MAG: PEP-CTERM sorting domain-containing protein [Chloroflexi bacterium]|nr:PEP-CTERM sorting domain-containing protein [Chloroflexota bacterium]
MKGFTRFTFLLSLLGFIATLVGGYQPVYAAPLDGPGDIAFIAFNADGNDNFSFVIFENIDAGQIIYFDDNEWTGAAMNTGEGLVTWTATTAHNSGFVVTIDNASTTPAANAGTVSRTGSFNLGATGDAIFAYIGTPSTPTAFLTAIANNLITSPGGTLTGTGLTVGTTAFEMAPFDADADIAIYTGARNNQSTASAYRTQIYNTANWISQDGAGDQGIDTIAPDLPFDNTIFTTPTAVTLSQTGAQTAALPTLPFALAFLMLAVASLAIGRRQRA